MNQDAAELLYQTAVEAIEHIMQGVYHNNCTHDIKRVADAAKIKLYKIHKGEHYNNDTERPPEVAKRNDL